MAATILFLLCARTNDEYRASRKARQSDLPKRADQPSHTADFDEIVDQSDMDAQRTSPFFSTAVSSIQQSRMQYEPISHVQLFSGPAAPLG